MNFNITRNFPFKNKKILPLIDFRLTVKADTTYAYISESTKDGLIILTNSDSFYTKTTYGEIYDQHGVVRGMLVYAYNPPYEISFSKDDGELDESVLYREALDGVRDIYIKHLNGDMERLPANFDINTENLNVEIDGSRMVFNCYEEEDQYDYLKHLDVNGVKTEGSHNVIFGRNIIKINGDEFGTTISDPNLLCPTIFTPGSIGETGDPGTGGADGKDGENVIEYFFSPYECVNPCDCFITSDCLNPNDTLESCVVEPYEPEIDIPITEPDPDSCSVCDSSDSGTGDPSVEPEPEPTIGCILSNYVNSETLEEVRYIEPTIAPLNKIEDGVFRYDYWDGELGETILKMKVSPIIPDGSNFTIKFTGIDAGGEPFSFCCINTYTSSSYFPYEEGYIYCLKPYKNCVDPFSYYIDESGLPITFYSTWAIDGVNPLAKELYVLYEDGTSKKINFASTTSCYMDYIMESIDYGPKLFSNVSGSRWVSEDNTVLKCTDFEGGYKWTITGIDGDKIFEFTNESSTDGSGTYVYDTQTIDVYSSGDPYADYLTSWQAYILFPDTLTSVGPIPYEQPYLFRNGDTHSRDPYYLSGEEFSLICGTYTQIPEYINSDLDSEHRFITPFEGPMKVIDAGASSIKVYDAVYGYSKSFSDYNPYNHFEFEKWQGGGEG